MAFAKKLITVKRQRVDALETGPGPSSTYTTEQTVVFAINSSVVVWACLVILSAAAIVSAENSASTVQLPNEMYVIDRAPFSLWAR